MVFFFNSREVKRCGKTLFELGIGNRSQFNVVNGKYVVGAGGFPMMFTDLSKNKSREIFFF